MPFLRTLYESPVFHCSLSPIWVLRASFPLALITPQRRCDARLSTGKAEVDGLCRNLGDRAVRCAADRCSRGVRTQLITPRKRVSGRNGAAGAVSVAFGELPGSDSPASDPSDVTKRMTEPPIMARSSTPARRASGSCTSAGFWACARRDAQNPTEEDAGVEAENVTASEATDPRGRLLAIERELGAEIFERGEVIRSLLLALVAGEHVLLLGPPGPPRATSPAPMATFVQEDWDENPYDQREGGATLTRASVKASYHGDIEGEGTVEYLMAYPGDDLASFAGLQRVVGRIGERSGSFVLRTNGTFENGAAKETWSVVPGSGTGDLRGLRGEGSLATADQERASVTLDYDFE